MKSEEKTKVKNESETRKEEIRRKVEIRRKEEEEKDSKPVRNKNVVEGPAKTRIVPEIIVSPDVAKEVSPEVAKEVPMEAESVKETFPIPTEQRTKASVKTKFEDLPDDVRKSL